MAAKKYAEEAGSSAPSSSHGSTEHLLEFSSDSSSAIPGLNYKQEWNAWVNDLQESLDFEALVEFLEGLKQ